MAGITELLAALAALPDVDTEELQAGFQTEFDNVSEAANARVEELIAENDALKREIGEVKARNYDLMVAATSETVRADEEEVADIPLIDDLFKEVK